MTEPPPRPPWYKRDLLPAWMPVWLAASALIALGFGVIFGLFLEDEGSWRVGLVAGTIGFGMGLVILTLASARSPDTPEGQRLAPPAVIRKTILTAVVALIPFIWVTDRRIRVPGRRGRNWTILTGAGAELIGLTALFLLALVAVWYVHDRRRHGGVRTSDVLSLAVAGLAFGYGLALVVQRHS